VAEGTYVGSVARRLPDKPALIMGESGEVVTYRELDERSNRLAHLLRRAGLRTEDAVAVMSGNAPRTPEVYWAAYRSGLRFTPVNHRLQAGEVAHILENSEARAFVASARHADLLGSLPIPPTMRTRLAFDGAVPGFAPYERLLEGMPSSPLADETEGGAMIYSSGTTGVPKGVRRPLSGRPPGSSIFGITSDVVRRSWDMDEDSVTLIPMPLYHSSGITRLMVAQSLGMTVVLMERFDALRALELIERHRVTHTIWVPTMFVRFMQLSEAERRRYDLSSQVRAVVGSGPIAPSVKERMIEWWGPIISETYGGTEGNGMTVIEAEDWLRHRGSVGRPVFGTIHIVGDDGRELPPGQEGLIYFEGGRPFEYHRDPQKTRSVHNQQGWSTLGDVGYVTPDGYLYITDRKADLIITGGLNVYPAEVEKVLIGHPGVDDVAVIGVPDEEYGEAVKAVVIPADPGAAGPRLEAELIAFCRSNLAHYKCPRSVDFVEELPRQPTGKLYKRLLRERYWAGRESWLL